MEPAADKRDSSLRIRLAPDGVALWSWPLRDEGWRAWLPLAGALALAALAGLVAGQASVAGLGAAVLLASLWRQWLPVQYELNQRGVTQRVLGLSRHFSWTAIGSYQIREGGVLLFADAARTPLSPLRSLFLRWSHKRTEVLALLQHYAGDAAD